MAIYKIFPIKDATIYSQYQNMNTGIDPILDISNLNIATNSNPQIARFFIQFSLEEIRDILNNKIRPITPTWDVELKSYIATAQGVNESTDIEVFPLAQNWNNGTGTYLDVPQTTDGCNWVSPLFKDSGTAWSSSGTDSTNNFITSSTNLSFAPLGGGAWYLSSSNATQYVVTQSFDARTKKDLQVNAKTVVEKWYSGSFINNGFIVKWEDSVEFNTNTQIQPVMQFYSIDTNTIYPPQLEFKWRDYQSILTGSATSSIVNTTNIVSSLAENPGYFTPDSVNKFRFNVAPKYPTRIFSTGSLFTQTFYLPTASYYAIKDLDTDEYVVDYNNNFTQLSSDNESNYFTVHMNGLEPERYYKICVKTTINGSTLVLDDNYYFKVVNAL